MGKSETSQGVNMKARRVPVSVQPMKDAVVVTIGTTRLGHEELESFGSQLADAAASNPGVVMVLDMVTVGMLASVVIGRIFQTRDLVLKAGGELRVAAAMPSVLHVFQVCRLDHIVGIFTSVDEALSGAS